MNVARDQLRTIVERVERLEHEKQAIFDDIREIYAEAKSNGFDNKAIKRIVAMRKLDAHKRAEEQSVLDLYLAALNMLPEN